MNGKMRVCSIVIAVFMVLAIPAHALCATIPNFLARGWIEPGRVMNIDKDPVLTADVWKLDGKKGTRVVIAEVVEPGKTPSEIFLFSPGTIRCVARAELTGNTRYLVLDHVIEEAVEYSVLIRQKGERKGMDYKLFMETIPVDGTYAVNPAEPDGKFIRASVAEQEEEMGIMKGVALVMAAPFLIVPKTVASVGMFAYSAVGCAIDLFNVPGVELYNDIIHYGQGQ